MTSAEARSTGERDPWGEPGRRGESTFISHLQKAERPNLSRHDIYLYPRGVLRLVIDAVRLRAVVTWSGKKIFGT
jgi:hypothetical protein